MAEKVVKWCSERVFSGDRMDIGGHTCGTNATILEDGKWWCKRHTKDGKARLKDKADEQSRQRTKEFDSRVSYEVESKRRYHLFPQLLEALKLLLIYNQPRAHQLGCPTHSQDVGCVCGSAQARDAIAAAK